MSLSRPESTYLRAPGVEPVRIACYPKRRRGFINDTRLASLIVTRPVAPIRPLVDEPCYADFFAPESEGRMEASA